MSRLPELKPEDMNEKQLAIFSKSGAASRGGAGKGPSHAMLFSPDFAERATSLGEFVLKKNSLGMRLSELAVLVTARHLSSRFEWWAHASAAAKHGIDSEVIEAIRTGGEPPFKLDDERIVYEISRQVHRDRVVKTETFDEAVRQLGIAGVVEVLGLLGYYTMAAMFISTFELEPPENPLGS